MEFLTELWLPILLSSVFVFVVSSLAHMVSPHHKSEHRALPDESKVIDALRKSVNGPGEYFFPHCASMKETSSPEFLAKLQTGPSGSVIVHAKGGIQMGKSLLQWFLFCVLISVFVAYLTRLALAPGADYLSVFRIAGTAATLGYAFSNFTNSMWKGISWWVSFKYLADGLAYALVTAGTFGWLWPQA